MHGQIKTKERISILAIQITKKCRGSRVYSKSLSLKQKVKVNKNNKDPSLTTGSSKSNIARR